MSILNTNTATNVIPVGIVTLFAGDLSNADTKEALISAGYLPCDGTSYSASQYPELYEVLGTAHGGSTGSFNVPDLRYKFVRGTCGTSNADPQVTARTSASPGGASGNAVGSFQTSGTALPNTPWILSQDGDHFHAFQHLSTTMHEVWSGSTDSMARWSSTVTTGAAGAHFHSLSGGDPATVPVNISLYWIIRATSTAAMAQTPAAALCAFGASASTSSPSGWLYCNGLAQALSTSSSAFSMAMGSNFGGDGVSVFNLPDLRGQFLRGTSHGTGRDPNALLRYAPQGGGNTGDAVGSAQRYATSIGSNPLSISQAGAHTHALALVPANDHHAAYGASGPAAYNTMEWTNSWTNTTSNGLHTHDITGGDPETRPINIYLDWIIANDTIEDAAPIGTITAYGGDVTSITNILDLLSVGWLPCIGQKLLKSNQQYNALYKVIGGIYGEDSLNFTLPDLRGYFISGAGDSQKTGQVLNTSQTGQPVIPFATTPVGDHTHQVTGIPTDTHVIDVVAGWDLAENNPATTASTSAGEHAHNITGGGDAESRPLNINVDYIIRFK